MVDEGCEEIQKSIERLSLTQRLHLSFFRVIIFRLFINVKFTNMVTLSSKGSFCSCKNVKILRIAGGGIAFLGSEQFESVRVCQGVYDASLIKAWDDWDVTNKSVNDHPKEFPGEQCYLVFVLAHGGKDLESFVLSNFEEAKSLLVQVAAALAVAEAAYEFEHRDLH
ncbi:hypothetical protein MKX01_009776, partial [Papaver californicum]